MKKILFIISILISLLLMPLEHGFANQERKTLIIVGDKDHPPYAFVDEFGVYKGFNIDIIKAVALETGYDIKIYYLPWWKVENYLDEGKADIIMGITYNEISRNRYLLSNSYFKDQQSIFVRADSQIIASVGDLQGKIVGIQRGDNITTEITNKYSLNYRKVETQPEGLQLLLKGDIDAFIGDELTGTYWLQKNNKETEVKIAGEGLTSYNYCFAVAKDNKQLISDLNNGLQEIQRKGTYDKIYQKWFGYYVLDKEKFVRNFILIAIAVAFGVSIIIVVLIRVNRLLKQMVTEKTSEVITKHQELLNVNSLMKTIFSNVKNGFILINNNLDITLYNSQVLNLFEIEGESTDDKVRQVLDKYIAFERITSIIERKGELLNQELNFKENNSSKAIGYNLTLTEDNNGAIISLWDKTEEKRYLHKMILDDKLAALGRLVSGIVHEIRNPLMTIKVLVDLIPQKIEEQRFKDSLVTLLPQEIDRLTSLLNELLDYSKPSESIKQMLELKDIFQSLLALFEPILLKKNIELVYDVGEHKVYTGENHLKQILINLLFNSIEAIEKCPGKIQINAVSLGDNSKTSIFIEDNGVGISEENLDKIFDPFFTTKQKGTGLGLATTYQLIKENYGEISISSVLDKGTLVQIIFPSSPGGQHEKGINSR